MPQITVDTGINTKPILNGAKEMKSAIQSLQGWVSKASKSMDSSMVGYARAMYNNAEASKEFKTQINQLEDSAQVLQNELDRLAKTKVDTKEYADLKAKIQSAQKELQRLYDINKRLNATGRASVPTKEYTALTKAASTARQALEELNKEYDSRDLAASYARGSTKNIRKKLEEEKRNYTEYSHQANAAARKAQKAGLETEQGQELLKQKEKYTAMRDDAAKKISKYSHALSAAESDAKKYEQLLDELAEKIEIAQNEYDELIAKQKELEASGGAIQMTDAMRKNQYEVQKAREKLAELNEEKKKMEAEDKATVMGDTTDEYKKAAEEAKKAQEELNEAKKQGQEKTDPLHIQQWQQMATFTGMVANGFARVQYAAQMAGHAIEHPLEALNRMIPVILSGLARLAQKAIDVAMSFGRWAIHNIVNGVRQLASWAINAAVSLGRMAGSAVVSFLQRLATAARNAAVQLARVAGKAVLTGLKGIGTLAAKAGKAILGIGKNTKNSNNSLKQAISLIVRYGFGVRSLFLLFRRLRGAVTDAFKNMAKGVPEVNKAISSLSASLGMLKNSLATAFQPVLNAIAPVLTQFMDMLSEAMTKVGMFFAALVGQDYVYKATKAQFDYAKSLDKTKKSAKEAENQLASFDELNILKAPNDSSSGTGTDTNAADAGKFVKTPLESGIKEFVDTLKRMFQSGEFDEIGKLLADKFNKFISSIDWDGYAVKIGNLVNGLVEFYNAFMENTNWQNIGQTIADVINGLVDTIDWEALGRAFSQKINAIFGILAGLVDRINAANLGVAISNAIWGFVNNIKWEEIGSTIGQGITKIADTIIYFAANFKWEDFATEVANGANALFSKITPSSVGGALVGIINGGFKFLLRFLRIFKFEEHGQALQEGIRTFVDGVNTDTIGEALKTAILGILSYVTPAIEDEETWNLAGVKLAGMLNKLFGVDQDGETIWTKLSKAIDGLIGGVISGLTGFVSTFEWGENGEKFRQGVLKLIENFPAGPLGHLINISIKGVLDGMGPTISDPKVWSELGTKLGTALNEMLGDKETWQKAGEVANGMMNGILTFGENFLTTFDETTAADNIKAALDEIKWGEIATKLWNTAKLAFQKAGNFMDVLFSESMDNTRAQIDPAYVEKITAFNSQSLGAKIGSRISEAFNKIPWGEIGKELWNNAKAAGTNIVDLIGALFNVTDADISAAGDDKFTAIGRKIGESIATAISKIPWNEFGSMLSTGVQNLFDTLNGFFQRIGHAEEGQVSELQEAIQQFFSGIDWEGVSKSILSAAWSIFINLGKSLAGAIWTGIKSAFGMGEGNMEEGGLEAIGADKGFSGLSNEMATMMTQMGTDAVADLYRAFLTEAMGESDDLSEQFKAIFGDSITMNGEMYDTGDAAAFNYYEGFLTKIMDNGHVKEEFKSFVSAIWGPDAIDALEAGKLSIVDFFAGWNNATSDEEKNAKQNLMDAIEAAVKGVKEETLEENSPSKRAARLGEDFMKGFGKGVGDEETDTKRDTVGVFDNIFGGIVASAAALALLNLAVSVSMNSMSDKMSTTLTTISSSFSTAWQTIGTTVTTAVSNIVSTVPRLFAEMGRSIADQGWWSVGDYIVAGIQSGVQDNWRWLERTVWNLAVSLYNTARNALGIHSPSKLFREGVGQMIGLGVAEGFEDTEPTIMNSVTEVADAMVDKMARTDMQFDVGTETALSAFSDKIADSFATLLDRLQAIADSVTFRTPAVAAGTVVPYNVAARVGGDSTGLVEALEVSNDDLASVIIQATNNAAVAIVDAIQRHGGINNPNVSAQTNAIIDEINRRTRANGVSPILM